MRTTRYVLTLAWFGLTLCLAVTSGYEDHDEELAFSESENPLWRLLDTDRFTRIKRGAVRATPRSTGWGQWSSWSACRCGGIQHRHRHCTRRGCTAIDRQTRSCPRCLRWGGWSRWSTCVCGSIQRRHRHCIYPRCTEVDYQTRSCPPRCPRWGSWSPWTNCQCGRYQSRHRECNHSGCTKTETERKKCPDCRRWGEWSQWSACRICGATQLRHRHCLDSNCDKTEYQRKTCPGCTTWGRWGTWSPCTCRRTRYRSRRCARPCMSTERKTSTCRPTAPSCAGGPKGWLFGNPTAGIDALPKMFKWMVELKYQGTFVCGGALVSVRHVLTAKSCTSGKDTWKFDVVLGQYRRNIDDFTEEHFDVFTIFEHPARDVSILMLSEGVSLPNDAVSIIDIASQEPQFGALAAVSGWGWTFNGDASFATKLKYFNLGINSDDTCNHLNIQPHQICYGALTLTPLMNVCAGDAGSPVVWLRHPLPNPKLIGIMSRGEGNCPQKYYYVVCASVVQIRPWIMSQIDWAIP